MKEYVEREALLKDIEESVVFTVRRGKPSLEIRGANAIIDRIKSAPTADVVEVVRCKDCINWSGATLGQVCRRWSGVDLKNHTQPEDFCSCGEREERK